MPLALYVARRVAVLVPTLFFASVLIFSLQKLLPGDAAIALAGEENDPAVVSAIRAKYHLDRWSCSTASGSARCCAATSVSRCATRSR